MGVSSCQNDEQSIDFGNDPLAVKVEATVGESIFSRSNPTGSVEDQKVFNSGDQIAISNDGAFVNYTFNGTSWGATTPSRYLKWEQNTMTFNAYYPTTSGTSVTAFTLPTDQSSATNIAGADYMTASSEIIKDGVSPISLTFERKTARVIVNIKSFGDQYTDAQKTVSNVKIISGASAIGSSSVVAVTSFANGTGAINSTYTALVVPTSAKSSESFITLTDGASNSLTVKGIPAHEAGKSYTYDLHVGKDAVSITNVTVADWETGEIINEGTEQIVPLIGDYYYQDGAYGSIYIDSESNPCIGIVYWTDPDNEKHVKIVSLNELTGIQWSTTMFDVGIGEYADIRVEWPGDINSLARQSGAANRVILNSFIAANSETYSIDNFPAFKAADDKGEGWYLPALSELQYLYCAYKGAPATTWLSSTPSLTEDTDAADKFNAALTTAGTASLASDDYWSATEDDAGGAWYVFFNNGSTSSDYKANDYRVRLVRDIIVP